MPQQDGRQIKQVAALLQNPNITGHSENMTQDHCTLEIRIGTIPDVPAMIPPFAASVNLVLLSFLHRSFLSLSLGITLSDSICIYPIHSFIYFLWCNVLNIPGLLIFLSSPLFISNSFFSSFLSLIRLCAAQSVSVSNSLIVSLWVFSSFVLSLSSVVHQTVCVRVCNTVCPSVSCTSAIHHHFIYSSLNWNLSQSHLTGGQEDGRYRITRLQHMWMM